MNFNQFTFSPLFSEYRMVDAAWDGRDSFTVADWPVNGRIAFGRGATAVAPRTFAKVAAGSGIWEYASDDQRIAVSNDSQNFYSF